MKAATRRSRHPASGMARGEPRSCNPSVLFVAAWPSPAGKVYRIIPNSPAGGGGAPACACRPAGADISGRL